MLLKIKKKIVVYSKTSCRFFLYFFFFTFPNKTLLFCQNEQIIFISSLINFCIFIMGTVREQRHSSMVQSYGIHEKFLETFRNLQLGQSRKLMTQIARFLLMIAFFNYLKFSFILHFDCSFTTLLSSCSFIHLPSATHTPHLLLLCFC